MTASNMGRRLVIAAAVAGLGVVQGCAVMTGPYVPDRSSTTSHSMVSQFSKLHFSNGGSPASAALHMPREQASGLFYLRY
jgi:hypothetical protein